VEKKRGWGGMANKKILLIEDEKGLVHAMKLRLAANNYDVTVALDGQDGLEKAKKENPDLMILDLMLPKMDGFKVCSLLKRDSRYKKIPIIVLTARAEESDKKMGQDAGADVYIVKPVRPEMLLSKIKELLKES
jgi:DNA-binding response OmpR family regulator